MVNTAPECRESRIVKNETLWPPAGPVQRAVAAVDMGFLFPLAALSVGLFISQKHRYANTVGRTSVIPLALLLSFLCQMVTVDVAALAGPANMPCWLTSLLATSVVPLATFSLFGQHGEMALVTRFSFTVARYGRIPQHELDALDTMEAHFTPLQRVKFVLGAMRDLFTLVLQPLPRRADELKITNEQRITTIHYLKFLLTPTGQATVTAFVLGPFLVMVLLISFLSDPALLHCTFCSPPLAGSLFMILSGLAFSIAGCVLLARTWNIKDPWGFRREAWITGLLSLAAFGSFFVYALTRTQPFVTVELVTSVAFTLSIMVQTLMPLVRGMRYDRSRARMRNAQRSAAPAGTSPAAAHAAFQARRKRRPVAGAGGATTGGGATGATAASGRRTGTAAAGARAWTRPPGAAPARGVVLVARVDPAGVVEGGAGGGVGAEGAADVTKPGQVGGTGGGGGEGHGAQLGVPNGGGGGGGGGGVGLPGLPTMSMTADSGAADSRTSTVAVMGSWGPGATAGIDASVAPTLREILSDDMLGERFEAWLVAEWAVELLEFVRTVQVWRQSYFESTPSARLARAKRIAKVFVWEGAALQVNVSFDACEFVRGALEEAERDPAHRGVDVDVFKPAFDEVVQLMEHGPCQRFMQGDSMCLERKQDADLLRVAGGHGEP